MRAHPLGIRPFSTGGVPCRTLLLLALAFAPACAGGSAPRGATERDSAGVVIVEILAPEWRDSSRWEVMVPPVLEIGVAEGERPYQLFKVRKGGPRP